MSDRRNLSMPNSQIRIRASTAHHNKANMRVSSAFDGSGTQDTSNQKLGRVTSLADRASIKSSMLLARHNTRTAESRNRQMTQTINFVKSNKSNIYENVILKENKRDRNPSVIST